MTIYSKPDKNVIAVNKAGVVLVEFDSINKASKTIQLSCRTISKKINKNKPIKFNNELIYLKSPL